jgi:hypothetical protein
MNWRNGLVIAGLVALAGCALLIALTSAGASLANGVANAANGFANAAASTALMASQCTIVFVGITMLAAGLVFGANALALRQRRTPQPPLLTERRPAWRLGAPRRPALPAPVLTDADLEDDDELAEALKEALEKW